MRDPQAVLAETLHMYAYSHLEVEHFLTRTCSCADIAKRLLDALAAEGYYLS